MEWGLLFFNDVDKDIIKDIAKIHKLDVANVELAYKEMVKKLCDEVKNEKKD